MATALRSTRAVALLAVLVLVAAIGVSFAFQPDAPATPESNAPAEPQPQPETEEEAKLPKLEDLPLPKAETLLRELPVDWIVLKTGRVIVTEPVDPRPKTLDAIKARIEASNKWPRPRTKEEFEDWRARRDALYYLTVTLPRESADEEPAEYRLHSKYISEILHHEDLFLRRVDAILDEGRLRDAYEMLFRLERRVRDWPGLVDRQNRLLFLEAGQRFERGEQEPALVTLEQLHGRDAGYRGLKAELGRVAAALMTAAFEANDYRQTRHFLGRLRRVEPEHAVAAAWQEKLLAAAREELRLAEVESSAGRHDAAAEHAHRAARIWPQTPGLPEVHRRHVSRFQQLRVGVLSLPGDPHPPHAPSAGDLRHHRLVTTPLFELDAVDEATHYRSAFLEAWEPSDLGRKGTFALRPRRGAGDPLPIVTTSSLAAALAGRIDPQSGGYDPRLATALGAVVVQSPFEMEIEFAHVPLRVEPLLAFSPVPREVGAPENHTGRFRLIERDDDRAVYRRRTAQPDGMLRYHVAEIVEERFASHDLAMQALLRGEVSMLPAMQAWDVTLLRNDGRFFVQPRALPRTHVLQFHPASEALRNRELRRALAYALDTRGILTETVLHDSSGERGRLVTAPFPTKSHAYNGLVAPRPSDPTLAVALALAAKKQLGGELPVLRLAYEPDPVVAAAAARLIEQWERAGIQVQVVEAGASSGEADGWDILYRTVSMAEPALDLWTFLTFSDVTSTESLRHFPDWLRREFLALESAGDWNSATAILRRLHEQLWAECHLIPLWETDEFVVLRKNIRGFRSVPVHGYQDVDRWIVEPWFSTEGP